MNDNRLNQLYPEKFSGSRNDLSFDNPCRWRLKEITAGDMRIIKLYPVRADYTQPRKFYSKPTRDAQQKLNLKNSAERFRLLFLANFCADSLYVTLTFAKEPPDKDKALEKYKYFIKKLKKSAAGEIKYLGVIETLNADGENTRIHIHAVFSGVDYDSIVKNWIYGLVEAENIKDVAGSGQYMKKTFELMPENQHHYMRSRNLTEPVTEVRTLDLRFMPDADELDFILKNPEDYIDEKYPECEMIGNPEIWCSSFMPGYYVRIEMVRSTKKEASKRNQVNGYHTHLANEMLGVSKSRSNDNANHPVRAHTGSFIT